MHYAILQPYLTFSGVSAPSKLRVQILQGQSVRMQRPQHDLVIWQALFIQSHDHDLRIESPVTLSMKEAVVSLLLRIRGKKEYSAQA